MPRPTLSVPRTRPWCELACTLLAALFPVLLVGPVALGALGALACRARPPLRVNPVSDAATAAFANARAALRASERPAHAAERERAREWAEAALREAPEWVAPQRLIDDLLREDLRGIEALSAHRSALARRAELTSAALAAQLYLAGRLEGRDGEERFEEAAAIDPALAWAQHGLAFAASARGDERAAISFARRALARARDPWERSFFTSALARFLVLAGEREDALSTLAQRLAQSDTSAADRTWLSVEAAAIGLEDAELVRRTTSYARALELLRAADLTESEVSTLVARMRRTGSLEDPDAQALVLALAVAQSPARDRLRAELMLEAGSAPLALGLLDRALAEVGRTIPSGPLARSARFAAQQFAPAVERWLADLPARVKDSEGLPADPRLARVVHGARALRASADDAARAAPLGELGDALVAAGWFREARAVAVALAALDLDGALNLESRALAGQELIDGLSRLARRIDLDRGLTTPMFSDSIDLARLLRSGDPVARDESLGPAGKIANLRALLAAMGPLFARANVFLGGDTDAARVASLLADSPRITYGPVAELAHPGPRFSAADEREGLGREGEPVPGFAAEMERVGRFAIFGELSGGGGPDGTILPRLLVEQRSGEHLGVRWSGTVAWCEGADLMSRAGRRGAHISAAALHEGYWVDIGAVRSEHAGWESLRRDFSGPGSAARVEQVLRERGFEVGVGDRDSTSARRERTRTGALLRESERVRLAVLRDRGSRADGAPGELGPVALEELIEVTAVHEEGHLCDRARFLPLSHNLWKLLAFLLDCGFSPERVGEALEYRAQLVALCDAPDPRIPLAQTLDAFEDGPSRLTAHASGYARLLEDLLRVFDERLLTGAHELSNIDRGYTLVHQLHHLAPEALRFLARELASQKRLTR